MPIPDPHPDPRRGHPITPEQMRAWAALLETTAIVQHAADRRLRASVSLSASQFEILLRIVEASEGALRMSEIADRLVVSPSSLTYQVTRLAERGLVERGASESDERVVLVRITDAGRAVVTEGVPEYVDVVTTMLLDHLPPDDLVALADILEGVREQLRSAPLRPRRGVKKR